MQLISLSVPVHLWPPASSDPVAVVALIGTSRQDSGRIHVEVHAVIPAAGGRLSLGSPVGVVLVQQAIAAVQVLEKTPSGK
jgi:hypothetical protein